MRSLVYAMAICGLSFDHLMAQHVHGVVEVGVVVEGGTVAVSLKAPLSDVAGFEHAPENDEQLERIRQAAAMLSNAGAMFGLADSASCRISHTSVDGPAYIAQHLADEHAAPAERHSGHRNAHDPHGAESGHDEPAAPAVHDHEDSGQHAEISASYEWVCGNISDLDSLALLFTDGFASIETIEIQILTTAGAHVVKAEGRAASVSLRQP